MNEGYYFPMVISLTIILICLAIVLFEHWKTKRIMLRLNQMLSLAMDGNFEENTFDESMLSAVESRLKEYLTASVVSARSLANEKEKIIELLADISHQTKTPLTNILLYAQLLEEQTIPEESRVCVTTLRGQAEKLSFLIDSLVKLSRLEIGVFSLHPMPNALTPMLEEAIKQYAPKAKQKEIQLTVKPTEAQAVFDYKWTLEALCNLLDNAIKYTPPGGSIQLAVEEYEMFCRIDVADTGIGIPEEEQAKVFSRFYRSPSVSEQEGVGIGLYLTRQILSEQSGYIKVISTPGQGSVFSMYLPRQS